MEKLRVNTIRKFVLCCLVVVNLSIVPFCYGLDRSSEKIQETRSKKQTDLVLIHGLANYHRWSQSFLDACSLIWGSGRVFIVYTNESVEVKEEKSSGRKLTFCGGNGLGAGTKSIAQQSQNLARAIEELHESGRLRLPFSIIAHSMGGLVSRQYSYENPEHVAGLVTLGTPHHGSPLADSFKWVGYFINAQEAIEELKIEKMVEFNMKFPVATTPLVVNQRVYLIRGDCDGTDCFGTFGELQLGYQILSLFYDTDNDGLVPSDSALIEGAELIKDFPDYDHVDLISEPDVAETAAGYLP